MKIREMVLSTVMIAGAGNAHSLVINGTNEFDIFGSESFVSAYDFSIVTTHIGSSVSFLDGFDNSTFNINGGEIAWLQLYDSNVTDISFVEDLSWLLVSDNSIVNISGSGFNYSNGHLSGTWANGTDFSFWALEQLDLTTGNIGDILPDNIFLHDISISEPSSWALLVFGITGLALRKNKTQPEN